MKLPAPSQRRSTPSPRTYSRGLLAIALACGFSAQVGCSVWQQARRTLLNEPGQYSWKWDRGRSLKTYRQWADEAWAEARSGCPEVAGDDDYALGFRDGFVDFVYAGGDGEPPPMPPRKFWNVSMRNPAGAAGAAQWFAGYRHGAQVARDGGYRENGIVPSSFRLGPANWSEEESPHALPLGEDLGPPSETLPEPGATEDYYEEMLPPEAPANASDAPMPEGEDSTPTLPTPELSAPEDALPETIPAAPPTSEPDAASEPELAPTRPDSSASSSTPRGVERFRRAVTTVQFVEPRRKK